MCIYIICIYTHICMHPIYGKYCILVKLFTPSPPPTGKAKNSIVFFQQSNVRVEAPRRPGNCPAGFGGQWFFSETKSANYATFSTQKHSRRGAGRIQQMLFLRLQKSCSQSLAALTAQHLWYKRRPADVLLRNKKTPGTHGTRVAISARRRKGKWNLDHIHSS